MQLRRVSFWISEKLRVHIKTSKPMQPQIECPTANDVLSNGRRAAHWNELRCNENVREFQFFFFLLQRSYFYKEIVCRILDVCHKFHVQSVEHCNKIRTRTRFYLMPNLNTHTLTNTKRGMFSQIPSKSKEILSYKGILSKSKQIHCYGNICKIPLPSIVT